MSSVAAAALVALVVAASAPAAKAPRTVALRIEFTGSGRVWVTGAVKWGKFNCTSTTSSPCDRTAHVPSGRLILLHEQPAKGWRLTNGWSAACRGSRAARNHLGSEQSCWLRLTAARSVNLIFVPPYPGSPFSPIPLGTAIGMGLDGSTTSQVTVNSATINANTEVEAVTDPNTGKPANGPPPAGDQYTLVNLTLTYVQGVLPLLTLSPGDWPLDQIAAEGAPLGVYDVEDNPDTCVPPAPDLGAAEALSTGQTETGNLCFTIASTDASTLLLRAIDNIYWKVPRYIFLALR